MRATYQGDTCVQRCDKCGRVLFRMTPNGGSPATEWNCEKVLPYTVRTEKKTVRAYNGIIDHGVLEEMYYCMDCLPEGELK